MSKLLPNKLVTPGLVDPHVHLREPGNNPAETIESGTRAAMFGGFVLVGDMPNTPGHPTWTLERMLDKHDRARRTTNIPITFHAGSQPEQDNISELERMARYCLWLKLYLTPTTANIRDYEVSDFRGIVPKWHEVAPDKPIGLHASGGDLEGMIAMIAGEFNHPLHIHHINSSEEINAIKAARDRGLEVTCGVCPHHLLKTSHDVKSEGWFARMQPPLTTQAESDELMRYLADGTIDILETDHAPHSLNSKLYAEEENPNGIHDEEYTAKHATCFGVPGIEFAAPLMFYQVKRGNISMERVIDAMSTRPAKILGINTSESTRVEWNMREYRIGDDHEALSLSGWTPYLGKLAIGKVNTLDISGQRLISSGEMVGSRHEVVFERGTTI